MSKQSKVRILVVDDDPGVRKSLEILLTHGGYDVATADNGVSAVEYLNNTVPDLLVTDLNMPHMSGVELISHVRNRYPEVQVVAMSGNYESEAVPASILADRFYPKGKGDAGRLLSAIASLIAKDSALESTRESGVGPALDS